MAAVSCRGAPLAHPTPTAWACGLAAVVVPMSNRGRAAAIVAPKPGFQLSVKNRLGHVGAPCLFHIQCRVATTNVLRNIPNRALGSSRGYRQDWIEPAHAVEACPRMRRLRCPAPTISSPGWNRSSAGCRRLFANPTGAQRLRASDTVFVNATRRYPIFALPATVATRSRVGCIELCLHAEYPA